MNNRRNGGFTLVELMVTIAVGSLITLAATTILLLGLRVNAQSTGTVTRQNTARILLSVLEDMATEGTITEVKSGPDSWQIIGDGEKVLFSYSSVKQTIYTGSVPADSSTGTPLLEDVIASFVYMNTSNRVLTFSVETEDGSYNSSVFCRTAVVAPDSDEENKDVAEAPDNVEIEEASNPDARKEFLKVLTSQYRLAGGSPNQGLILDDEGRSTGVYYSQWYNSEWKKDTPWCACFVSWGLNEVSNKVTSPEGRKKDNGDYRWYAAVDDFVDYLKRNDDGNEWKDSKSKVLNGVPAYTPQPGDLIFFDWYGGINPAHVGVVLEIVDDVVYTIEGNSANMVAIRKYELSDSRIMGYGVLNWK